DTLLLGELKFFYVRIFDSLRLSVAHFLSGWLVYLLWIFQAELLMDRLVMISLVVKDKVQHLTAEGSHDYVEIVLSIA
ncbi:hypothetical protein ACNIRM_25145, partial [Escherichia coli]